MQSERFELKYCIERWQVPILENAVKTSFAPDPFCNEYGNYTVNSLYFDDYSNTSAYEVEAGLQKKTKYRIRYYNNNIGSLKLEIKKKEANCLIKESCPITPEEFKMILNNDVSDLFWSTDKNILKRFIILLQTKLLMPKVIVSYKRIPFVVPYNNVRLTIDHMISSSKYFDNFLNQDCTIGATLFKNSVLEIKYNNCLPTYIKDFFDSFHLSQSTFSKYYTARCILGDKI